MRTSVQIVGGIVLGLGPAAAVGLDPGPVSTGCTLGPGALLLCLGLPLPEDPDTAVDRHDRCCPPPG